MPLPKNRSNSVRKIVRKGMKRKVIIYKRRTKGKQHYCAICSQMLQGTNSESKNPKTAKIPNRKFGGNLCTQCSSTALKLALRLKEKAISTNDIDVKMLKHVKGVKI